MENRIRIWLAACGALAFFLPLAFSQPGNTRKLDETVRVGVERTEDAQNTQEKITEIASETRTLESEYRVTLQALEAINTYNRQMEQIVGNQQKEIDSIDDQLGKLNETRQGVLPLMDRMIRMLEQFMDASAPFLQEERRTRLENLKKLMVDANVSHAERYRKILEAYQIEHDYSRNIEAYEGKLDGGKTVQFLRIGRVGLYYQTLDQNETGLWDNAARTWTVLKDEKYRFNIGEAIKIARKQAAPALLTLPVPAATASK